MIFFNLKTQSIALLLCFLSIKYCTESSFVSDQIFYLHTFEIIREEETQFSLILKTVKTSPLAVSINIPQISSF